MLGMEPKQIARVVRQQEALFESSVYEGLIAVDPEGHITAINRNARKNVGAAVAGRQWLGKLIAGSRQSGGHTSRSQKDARGRDGPSMAQASSPIVRLSFGGEALLGAISFRSKR
ncbi:hypothetical protein KCP74_23425 [Salmonella enterica subsp. enterica]|nr:hypothetical protein KCP74_23425 [Salmonella enterica subsp. enterica]